MHSVKVLFSQLNNSNRKLNLVTRHLGKFELCFLKRYCTDMEDLYDPPKNLRGMKVLDRSAFKKTVNVSCLIADTTIVSDVLLNVKEYLLKIMKLKNVDKIDDSKHRILLDSKKINKWEDFDEKTLEKLKNLSIQKNNFSKVPIELNYENWSKSVILKTLLPEEEETCFSSFSLIGHIIHLNIPDNLLEYKNIVAEVLLDKVSEAKTVVYKKNIIDNVYRNFEMEVLCGEPNLIAVAKENNCTYELDFSKVYWNPRLSTEHNRIIGTLNFGDVLFDVFAGVGPFAIPVAKKKCLVFANDLNPESVKWLKHNITLNKKSKDYITVYNKDGSDFILTDIKENLIKTWKNEFFNGKIHVVMNLPAIAPTFIKYFRNLIDNKDIVEIDIEQIKKCLPIIHCYFFTKTSDDVRTCFEESSGLKLNDIEHSFQLVRNVSPGKRMHKITFTLPFNYLVAENLHENDEPLPKRICMNEK